MVHQFPLRYYTSRAYFLLLTYFILMKSVVTVANERRGQEINGSSECDETIVYVNLTLKNDVIPTVNTRNTVQNNSIFEKEVENTKTFKQFETYGENNTINVLASSTLSENKTSDLNNFKQKGNIKSQM